MNTGLSDADLEKIRAVFRRFPRIDKVLLFGSRALGTYKNGSDIDLALVGDTDLTLVAQIKAVLEEEVSLPYFFDVVDYGAIEHADFKSHIDRYGKVLYSRN